MKLVIGNKNYSSWSLRPWLLLHGNGVEFEEIQVSLQQDNISERLSKYSDSNKVPVLIDDEVSIWDSLAICEYISEKHLSGRGWPEKVEQRGLARSIVSEMHSGFFAVRSEMPMNCRLNMEVSHSDAVKLDVQRIETIWSNYAQLNSSMLSLFGGFGIADCFFAPIALRFRSYGVSVTGRAAEYQDSLLSHPSIIEWVSAGILEEEVLPQNEI